MSEFLDSILKIIPAVQSKHISNFLNKLQIAGEIKNTEEYSSKLEELSLVVNNTNPIPSFNYITASVWSSCSSQAHNYMMQLVKNDFESLFHQLDEIGNKIEDNNNLILNSISNDILKNLQTQENKINEFKWIANKNNEFTIANTNTFKLSSLFSTNRSDINSVGLFYDNRTYINKTEVELPNAIVNESMEQLTLKPLKLTRINPTSISLLFDEYSYGTEENTSLTNIENLIDNKFNTYWSRNVYLSKKVPKVNTILNVSFGNGKDINYIHIDNGSENPIFISSIIGIKPDLSEVVLLDDEIEFLSKKEIYFTKQFLKGFKITFSVYTYIKSEFYSSNESIVNTMTTNGIDNSIVSISKDVLNSTYLSNLCNATDFDSKQINSYVYSITLDNIYAGFNEYEDIGIFVSKPLYLKNIGVLSINSEEEKLTEEISNTIEYEIIKKDLFPYSNQNKFSIPYLDQKNVYSERLIFINKEDRNDINNSGFLRFCPYVDPNITISSNPPIRIYENGSEINLGSDYEYATETYTNLSGQVKFKWIGSNWLDAANFSNYKLIPQKMWIKIINPNQNSVYTVSYQIRTSDSYVNDNTVWLDKDKTVFLCKNGRVNFYRENLNYNIESNIYLQITLRKNLPIESSNVLLPGYSILAATYSKE